MPELGIGVTTYNRCATLAETIERIRTYTKQPYTLVVTDDGSYDGTAPMLREMNVPHITGKNRGVAWNKNRALYYLHAIRQCRVVILLEDDTWPDEPAWEAPWVEAAYKWGHINIWAPWDPSSPLGGNGTPDDPFFSELVTAQCASFSSIALSLVGYMDTRFRQFGHEHAEHTSRMVRAGFGGRFAEDDLGRPLFYKLLTNLKFADVRSHYSEDAARFNGYIWERLRHDGIYRNAWRSDGELANLHSELTEAFLPESERSQTSVPLQILLGTGPKGLKPSQSESVNVTFTETMDALWRGLDPYRGFPKGMYAEDLQGWNSDHPYLSRAVRQLHPKLVVEVGVWKGASTITLAKALKQELQDGAVIAVDTWLGSWDHWGSPEFFAALSFQNGWPQLFYKFINNVLSQQVADYVVPFPLDSANAAVLLERIALRPSVIHLDAAHDFESVTHDLRRWWPLLLPGGVLIADDYDPEGKVWPEVQAAVNAFFVSTPHSEFESEPYKCWVRKPA
jgi:glycosyltransferase involved in cell wall biosynthesis